MIFHASVFPLQQPCQVAQTWNSGLYLKKKILIVMCLPIFISLSHFTISEFKRHTATDAVFSSLSLEGKGGRLV